MPPAAQNQASDLLLLKDLKTTWTKPVLNEADGPFPEISWAALSFPRLERQDMAEPTARAAFSSEAQQ